MRGCLKSPLHWTIIRKDTRSPKGLRDLPPREHSVSKAICRWTRRFGVLQSGHVTDILLRKAVATRPVVPLFRSVICSSPDCCCCLFCFTFYRSCEFISKLSANLYIRAGTLNHHPSSYPSPHSYIFDRDRPTTSSLIVVTGISLNSITMALPKRIVKETERLMAEP